MRSWLVADLQSNKVSDFYKFLIKIQFFEKPKLLKSNRTQLAEAQNPTCETNVTITICLQMTTQIY